MAKSKFDEHSFQLQVDVVEGGFILSYPKKVEKVEPAVITPTQYTQSREIFTSQQKLSKKIKEVLDEITSEEASQ